MDDILPPAAGTFTFLFTDIEGSTRLWEQHPDAMRTSLARHNALLTEGIVQHGGVVVKSRGEGDSFFAVFSRPTDAVTAAGALQQALLAEPWPAETPLRVRMALHTGEADLQGGDYYGPAVNRCARLRAVAHGGQVLLSQTTADRVRDQLPEVVSLRDLGTHRLKDLQQPEHLYQLLHPALPSDFPPLRSLEAFAHNLPRQLTRFIGREREMAEVKQLLAMTSLLTLTGSGGCGKTRLALQVAADLVEAYADGVWLVELAALADPGLVPQAVVSALGVREEPGCPVAQTLVDYLRPKQLLLLLDNCEHLLAAAARLAEALLRACPGLRILASSREGLGIAGEQTYRVPSLSSPDPKQLPPWERLQEFEAVSLFADRAILSQPTFAVTAANAPAVAAVCQRLDGIPLAIELAAARVKALPVEKIAERLDDRFRLLTGGSRTALPRQQTLRALIDWSYDLLSEAERALLRRLTVFAGGWTLEAAEAVCGDDEPRIPIRARKMTNDDRRIDGQGSVVGPWSLVVGRDEVLDLLTALVEKSLVVYEEREGEARYRLLETLRQYGRDRLSQTDEVDRVRDCHQEFFLQLAERAAPAFELCSPDSEEWAAHLDREHDNLRAALTWALERGHGVAGLRLAEALIEFWQQCGHYSIGREALTRALNEAATAPAVLRAKAFRGAGWLAIRQGDYPEAKGLLEQALVLSREQGDRRTVAGALQLLGWVALAQGETLQARGLAEESLQIWQQLGDRRGIDGSLAALGRVALRLGEFATARACFEESLEIVRQLADKRGIGVAHWHLGQLACTEGNYPEARAHLERSLAILEELGDQIWPRGRLLWLGRVACRQGDGAEARRVLRKSLEICRSLGDKRGIAEALEALAEVAGEAQQTGRATRLTAAAQALCEVIGAPIPLFEQAHYDLRVSALQAALGEEAFAAAWAEGRAMSLHEAVALAVQEDADA